MFDKCFSKLFFKIQIIKINFIITLLTNRTTAPDCSVTEKKRKMKFRKIFFILVLIIIKKKKRSTDINRPSGRVETYYLTIIIIHGTIDQLTLTSDSKSVPRSTHQLKTILSIMLAS